MPTPPTIATSPRIGERVTTMRAVTQTQYGTDPRAMLTVAHVPRPGVGDDEVLVRVAAAGVDMGTWHCLAGMPYAMRLAGFGLRAPKALNPGRAFAGQVESVGAAVTSLQPGDRVVGTCDGSFAELVATRASQVALAPHGLTLVEAAALPISATTALEAIQEAGVEAGHRVLVLGASGGVGSFAVQIAVGRGAEVTGVCSDQKIDFVRSLGAHHVLDYRRSDPTDGSVAYDAIIDIAGNRRLRHLQRALTPHGVLVIVGGETGGRWLGGVGRSLRAIAVSPFVRRRLTMLVSSETAGGLDAVRDLVDAGTVTPALERTYSLDETAEAIRHVHDGRARGKVVVTID